MSEDEATYLTGIHERDQNDAEVEAISRAVARHFTILREAGMFRSDAMSLCREFQHELMGGDGASIMLMSGEGDDE